MKFAKFTRNLILFWLTWAVAILGFQSLLAHPLGQSEDKVQDVLDDLLDIDKGYLLQFLSRKKL